jgi:hypothetical protein
MNIADEFTAIASNSSSNSDGVSSIRNSIPVNQLSLTKRTKSQFNLNNQSLIEVDSGTGNNLARSFLLDNPSE